MSIEVPVNTYVSPLCTCIKVLSEHILCTRLRSSKHKVSTCCVTTRHQRFDYSRLPYALRITHYVSLFPLHHDHLEIHPEGLRVDHVPNR